MPWRNRHWNSTRSLGRSSIGDVSEIEMACARLRWEGGRADKQENLGGGDVLYMNYTQIPDQWRDRGLQQARRIE